MHEGPQKPKRKSQEQKQESPQVERAMLLEEIRKMQDSMYMIDKRIAEQKHKQQKVVESNQRNEKRLLRYRARIEEMMRYKDSPQHLLAISGLMSESIQEYILSHNYTFSTDPHEVPDPDHMSYEQLLDLGERIGKVSKGLSKEQIDKLDHKRNKSVQERCPICQCEFQLNELVIELRCRHSYHQECILAWLKDENTCPICKESLVERGMKEEGEYM